MHKTMQLIVLVSFYQHGQTIHFCFKKLTIQSKIVSNSNLEKWSEMAIAIAVNSYGHSYENAIGSVG